MATWVEFERDDNQGNIAINLDAAGALIKQDDGRAMLFNGPTGYLLPNYDEALKKIKIAQQFIHEIPREKVEEAVNAD